MSDQSDSTTGNLALLESDSIIRKDVLELFSENYFHSYEFRLAIASEFENAVRQIQMERHQNDKMQSVSMSVASSSLIRRLLIAVMNELAAKLPPQCGVATVYDCAWQLLFAPSAKQENTAWRSKYPWPLSDSILSEHPRSLCQVLDIHIGSFIQGKHTNILPDPRKINCTEQDDSSSSVSTPLRPLDVVTLLVTFFNLIVVELLELSARECDDHQGRDPYLVQLSDQDRIAEKDELERMRTQSVDAVSLSPAVTSKVNSFEPVVLQLEQDSLFLYSYFLSKTIFFLDKEFRSLIQRLNMCEAFGFVFDTPAARFLRSRKKNLQEDGYYVDRDSSPPHTLFSLWNHLSTNPSIDGTTLGKFMSDSWRFQLKVCDSQTESGTFENIFCNALVEDGTPIPNHLPDIDNLHSMLHEAFETSGARQLLQPAIEAMWWNDERLLQQYAVDAVASGVYRRYSKIGGNSLFTQALHVKPRQMFGRSARSLLHGRECPPRAEGSHEERLYQYMSFSLLDANEHEYPFLAEIMIRKEPFETIPERGLVYTYVKGEQSCLVGVMSVTRTPDDDVRGLYLDVARLRQAMPSFANYYKPHAEFHRSFIRYWQAKSVIQEGVNTFPGCIDSQGALRRFHQTMGFSPGRHVLPQCLDTASIDDVLEIECTGKHAWFSTDFLKDGSFGDTCPPDPQKAFLDMIAHAQLTPEQELQFELELTMCAAMRMFTDYLDHPSCVMLLSLTDIQPLEPRRRFAEMVREEQIRIAHQGQVSLASSSSQSSTTIAPAAIYSFDLSVDDLTSVTTLIPDLAGIVKEYLDPLPFLPFVPDEVHRMCQREWNALLEPWWDLPRLD